MESSRLSNRSISGAGSGGNKAGGLFFETVYHADHGKDGRSNSSGNLLNLVLSQRERLVENRIAAQQREVVSDLGAIAGSNG